MTNSSRGHMSDDNSSGKSASSGLTKKLSSVVTEADGLSPTKLYDS